MPPFFVVVWIALTFFVLDVNLASYSVLTSDTVPHGPQTSRADLGKPAGDHLIDFHSGARVSMHELHGNWTLIVFDAMGPGDSLETKNMARPSHDDALRGSLWYFANNLHPHGAKLVLIRMDHNPDPLGSDPCFYIYSAASPSGCVARRLAERSYPWDRYLLAAERFQRHPRYYGNYYLPARRWLQKEWINRFEPNARHDDGPTHELKGVDLPLYAILDKTGSLRWFGAASPTEVVATLYKAMGLQNAEAGYHTTHVLTPLLKSEHTANGLLNIDDAQRLDDSARIGNLERVKVCSGKRLPAHLAAYCEPVKNIKHTESPAARTIKCSACGSTLLVPAAYLYFGIKADNDWPTRPFLAIPRKAALKD